MLPLEKLSDEAKLGFEANGVNETDIDLCIELDLNTEGNFGATWLAVDNKKKKFYRMSVSSNADMFHTGDKKKKNTEEKKIKNLFKDASFTEYDLKDIVNPYIDNFVTSNRLMAKTNVTDENTGDTIIIAYATNARKRKMFAFIDIIERFIKDEEVKNDDPIFEQFNLRCPTCDKVYEDQNRKICETCTNQSAVLKRLMKYISEYKFQFMAVVFCMISSSLIQLVNPLITTTLMYDQVISEDGALHSIEWVYAVIAIIFGIAILSLLINIIQNRTNAHLSTRVTLNMKLDIFSAMQKLSLSFFNNNQTGRLITRVNYDADRIRGFLIDAVPNLVINGLNFIGLLVICFIMNWKLTLIVLIPVPIIVFIFKFRLPQLWRAYTKEWRSSSSLNAFLGDALTGIRVVKAFAKEAEESNRFYGYSEKLYKSHLNVNKVSITIFPIIGLLIAFSSKAIWGFGGIMVMEKTMTYGQFGAYFAYLGMIFGPLHFFTAFTDQLTQAMNSAQRMFEIIDTVPEITEVADAVHIERLKGEIEFKKVCFHYAANRPILKNVSFKINPGDNIGLVGHTGSGKSTIANLINRLYDVISGSIKIDGVNVKKLKNDTLRRNIAIVSQEIFLFKGTIADNIRYARPDASLDDVITAAKIASAHDFILSLPEGYQTVVGTGSRSLSGGEQQRISIARALLLNPSILILDEATAAMDTETERLIQDALNKLVEGRTTITIAHRLSTLKECNYLFAIENGEIAEQGTHSALIAAKGLYYKLYTLQSEAMKKVIQGM